MGIPSELRDAFAKRRNSLLVASPMEDEKILRSKQCTQEGVRAGAKAAAVPTFLRQKMLESENKAAVGLSWEPKFALVAPTIKEKSPAEESGLYKPESQLVDGLFLPPNDPRKLNKLSRKQVKDTAGKNWFDMPAQTITPELKKDLQLLKLRGVIDPKRHYKKGDAKSLPKYFQVGTVIESPSEFFSGRLTKKERKATLAEELLSDGTFHNYRKRKVREIEEQNRPGGVDKWKQSKFRKHGKNKKKGRH